MMRRSDPGRGELAALVSLGPRMVRAKWAGVIALGVGLAGTAAWALSTAPVEVPVVEAAKMPETGAPKRASLPSMFEPTAPIASRRGLPRDSRWPAGAALA